MIDALAAEGVTHVMTVPSQLVALLQHDDFDEAHLPRLEMIGSLGAPLLLEHKQELMRRLPRRLYELYGLTEGFVTILDRDDVERKPGRSACRRRSTRSRILGARRRRASARRGRRDRRPRADHDARLPRAARPHRRHARRRLDPERRPRLPRRRRLPLPRRPEEGPDHLRRRQRLPARHRGGGGSASRRARRRRLRRARRELGREPDRRGPAAPGTPRDDAEALREWINAHVQARYQRFARSSCATCSPPASRARRCGASSATSTCDA